MIRPEDASFELIRSGPRRQLNLTRTATRLRVRRRDDDANFVDQIGTDVVRRIHSVVVSAVIYRNAVSCRIDLADTSAGKIAHHGHIRRTR